MVDHGTFQHFDFVESYVAGDVAYSGQTVAVEEIVGTVVGEKENVDACERVVVVKRILDVVEVFGLVSTKLGFRSVHRFELVFQLGSPLK